MNQRAANYNAGEITVTSRTTFKVVSIHPGMYFPAFLGDFPSCFSCSLPLNKERQDLAETDKGPVPLCGHCSEKFKKGGVPAI